MIDKRSESNISTYESKKAAVRSHIGSRTAACLLIFYSFLSLGVRTTPDHKSGRAHLQNVASRWAKLKFWKIEFLQLFHSKSGALYVKTPHFRAAFSALHLSSTHFGPSRIIGFHEIRSIKRFWVVGIGISIELSRISVSSRLNDLPKREVVRRVVHYLPSHTHEHEDFVCLSYIQKRFAYIQSVHPVLKCFLRR